MTSIPSDFLLTTDFPTFKNDASAIGTVNINGGLIIAGGGNLTASSDFGIGTQGAITRTRWASSVDNFTYFAGQYIIYLRTGTVSGSAAPYNIFLSVFRTASTTMRLQIVIPNPYGATLTGAAAEVISMYSETFIAPNT